MLFFKKSLGKSLQNDQMLWIDDDGISKWRERKR